MAFSKEKSVVQQAFWGQGPLCTCFFSPPKPFAPSNILSELQHHGGDTPGDFSERQEQAGLVWAGWPMVPTQLNQAVRTHWNPAGNGFFWFVSIFLHTVSLSVNACVPYTMTKTRISWSSFIPHSIFHSLILFFINFPLKIDTHNSFKFCIYTTSKHFSESFFPSIFQLSGAGVRYGDSTAGRKDVQPLRSSPAVIVDLWGNWASNTKKPFCDAQLFSKGNGTSGLLV